MLVLEYTREMSTRLDLTFDNIVNELAESIGEIESMGYNKGKDVFHIGFKSKEDGFIYLISEDKDDIIEFCYTTSYNGLINEDDISTYTKLNTVHDKTRLVQKFIKR